MFDWCEAEREVLFVGALMAAREESGAEDEELATTGLADVPA